MAPRADMKWSVHVFEESYYLSNICPQNHDLNAGDWLKTENLARRMAEKYGECQDAESALMYLQIRGIAKSHYVPMTFSLQI